MTISKKINDIFKSNLSDSGIFNRLVEIDHVTCKIADQIVEHYQWREYDEINQIVRQLKSEGKWS